MKPIKRRTSALFAAPAIALTTRTSARGAAAACLHRSPRGGPLIVTALVILGSSACGGHKAAGELPSASTRSTPAPAASPAVASQDAVTAAYNGFLAAANKAITAPPDQARTLIAPYAVGDFLEFQLRQVAVHQKAHEEPWGNAVVHITKVTIAGSKATLHDCQDDSGAGLADRRTHALIDGSRGTAHQNLVADLTVGGDGRWRVSGLRLSPGSCHLTS